MKTASNIKSYFGSLEVFLYYSIAVLVFITLLALLILFTSRFSRIVLKKRNEMYLALIEVDLFKVLFESSNLNENKLRFPRNKKYNELLVNQLINLHKNYDDKYAQKLEVYYNTNKLDTLSQKKIRSRRPHRICEGITELSEMNQKIKIREINTSKILEDETLKFIVLQAIFKNEGIKENFDFLSQCLPINAWTQLLLVESIKNNTQFDFSELDLLFSSEKESMIILGLNLVESLKLLKEKRSIETLLLSNENQHVKQRAEEVLLTLSPNNTFLEL